MDKKTYYVNMQAREISQIKFQNNHHFEIKASRDEVEALRRLLNKVYDADRDAYWRSHIPFVPYHQDSANDQYDESFTEALQLIYQLGDEKTKMYVESTGVLSNRSLDSRRN